MVLLIAEHPLVLARTGLLSLVQESREGMQT